MSISTITRNILRRTVTFSNNNTNLIWIRNGSTNIQQQSFDNDGLTKMVKSDKVVVFMKGVPEAPKCGFSNAVVQVSVLFI